MQVFALPDVVPGGVATPLSQTSIKAVWVAVNIFYNNVGQIRIGDASVSATRGILLQPYTVPYTIPRGDFNQGGYDLSKIYAFGTGTDYVTVFYGQ